MKPWRVNWSRYYALFKGTSAINAGRSGFDFHTQSIPPCLETWTHEWITQQLCRSKQRSSCMYFVAPVPWLKIGMSVLREREGKKAILFWFLRLDMLWLRYKLPGWHVCTCMCVCVSLCVGGVLLRCNTTGIPVSMNEYSFNMRNTYDLDCALSHGSVKVFPPFSFIIWHGKRPRSDCWL